METSRLILMGWWGYLICALIYSYGAWTAGDMVGLAGSLFFLGATVCFMIAFARAEDMRKRGAE